MQTVQISIRGVWQDASPFKGCIRFRLSRTCTYEDESGNAIVVPSVWQEVDFDKAGEAMADLVPNAMLGEGTFYEYQILRKPAYAKMNERYIHTVLVQSGAVVVPDHDCEFLDIVTVEPTQAEPLAAAQAYASEAKAALSDVHELFEQSKQHAETATEKAGIASDNTDISVITDGTTTYYALATPKTIDISDILQSDNYIKVENGGQLIFKNQLGDSYQIPVPSEIAFMTKA